MRRENTKPKNFCTFYIVRHGQTVWNVEGKLQGQKDSPLTEAGIEQAKKAGELLKQIEFHEAFSSDLLRAKRTAELITLEKKLIIKTSELLRERTYGSYEGKKRKELQHLLDAFESLNHKEKFKKSFAEGVESDEKLSSRFITFLREVALGYPNKNVLVVCHGGIMRSLLIHLGFGDYKTMPHYTIKNGSIITLLSDGVEFIIKETNGIERANKS